MSTFTWPPAHSLKALAAALGARVAVQREPRRAFERTYLDTFDGRLYRLGWTLASCVEPAGRFLEGRALSGELRCRVALLREPLMAGDLPAGGLAEALAERIAPRRLLPQAVVAVQATRFRCLDERQKTIARVLVERRQARLPVAARLPSRVVVEGLRGFEEAAIELLAVCGELGLTPTQGDELAEVLARVDRRPGQDPARLDFDLGAGSTAGAALATVHRALLGVMQATERGVREELDVEFLHDYRVALRRTRSTLGQISGVYGEEPTERFRRELGRLARETGPARDLDVFAEEIRAELALDSALGPPLQPLLALLRRERRRAGRRLQGALDSPRTRRVLGEWTHFLAAPEWGPRAAQPARAVFGEALARAQERLLRRGSRLEPTSPPEDFHRLRIDAKKLRYVLETGASLFDAEAVAGRLAPVKALQELLGEAQDLAVREARLADAANELATSAGPATLLAVGRLIERAHRRRSERYRDFGAAFGLFAAAAEQKRWLRLLRPSR